MNDLKLISNPYNISVMIIYIYHHVTIYNFCVCFLATGNNSYLLPTHRKCKGPPTVHRDQRL